MGLPTSGFSLRDVVTYIFGSRDPGKSLYDCFASYVSAFFDPAYQGSKDRLSNFGNYGRKLSLSSSFLIFNYVPTACADTTITITATANEPWTVSWSIGGIFSASKYSGSGNDSVVITALSENYTGGNFVDNFIVTLDNEPSLYKGLTVTEYNYPNECS